MKKYNRTNRNNDALQVENEQTCFWSLENNWFMALGMIPDRGSSSHEILESSLRSPSIVNVLPVPVWP